MGKIVDAAMATDPDVRCKGYMTRGKPLVWKRGIVGALSESQIREFCDKDTVDNLPKATGGLKKTLEGFEKKHSRSGRGMNLCDLSAAMSERREKLGANFCVPGDKLSDWKRTVNRVKTQKRFKEKDFDCLVRVIRHIEACGEG